MPRDRFKYEVCLSFAEERRMYVGQVAHGLRSHGVRVFYDEYEQTELWGSDLYSYLDKVYREECRHCIVFVSKEYAKKSWANHELRSAQARELREKGYILPVRFDDTPISGLPETVGYIDLNRKSPTKLVDIAVEKLKNPPRRSCLSLDFSEHFGTENDEDGIEKYQERRRSSLEVEATFGGRTVFRIRVLL